MKILMIDDTKHNGVSYVATEQRVVADEIGQYFCDRGWAQDADGVYPTGQRSPGAVVLSPEKVAQIMGQTGV